MNIFILHTNPRAAARDLCDKHVVKMVLETAQILSAVWHKHVSPETARAMCEARIIYMPTHMKHPCVEWAAATADNYAWLVTHGQELSAEYTKRYGKIHKCHAMLHALAAPPIALQHIKGRTPFVQCMPAEYRRLEANGQPADPVAAYRAYYKGAKAAFATWRHNREPAWWSEANRGYK